MLLDDTFDEPETKLRRADLIGIPFQLVLANADTLGPAWELRVRRSGERHATTLARAPALLAALLSREQCLIQ